MLEAPAVGVVENGGIKTMLQLTWEAEGTQISQREDVEIAGIEGHSPREG